ncbi:MAG: hypothetical protein LBS46_01710 [Dysgonamonadaceae bacterium]|nr:hypothetical protein [Dysgonamonadaceae bacterium]
MKKVRLLSLLLIATLFFGCGPNDQTILKKYETYLAVDASANKAGIGLELAVDSVSGASFRISYSTPALNLHKANADLLSGRLFMVNAENPSKPLDVETVTATHEIADNDSIKTSYYSAITLAKETTAKYALVCFKGIDKGEFERAETPPCFFIVSLDKKNPHVLTDIPLAADDFVAADYPKGKFIRFTEPQIYSGTIAFEKSKNVELKLTLSADATQVTELDLLADELHLDSKKSYIVSVTFKGGFSITKPIDILNDKIVIPDFFCDLTVTDACIYGTVQILLDDCATKKKYAVFRNITTPQEVPENILESVNK